MAKAILICGKLCSGKSTLARKIHEETGAVIISCDELMLKLFPQGAGELHDELAGRVKAYLYSKAEEILKAGCDVVVEWGFWSRRERKYANEQFRAMGAEVVWHFLTIDEETHRKYIDGRNAKILAGESTDYFVDEGLYQKFRRLFDELTEEEMAELTK